ncbi:MAG: ankyrin repeat domain-containing protein [Planctomycetota bacterium]
MDRIDSFFSLVCSGDTSGLSELMDQCPGLVHARHHEGDISRSALSLAAMSGQLDVCRLLVDRGAEVYPNPFNQYPPVMEAAWKEHQQVVDYFLKEIPDRADGTQGLGVMINLAGRQGWTEIVRQHIERDPLSVHSRGWIGDSPLHWPAHNNHVEIVSMLIEAGADVEADEVNWIGGKPLHWASEHAPDTVRRLLEAGADVNGRNVRHGSTFYQVTPLIMNATQNDDCVEVTEQLLAAGADIHAVDAEGRTALQHAEKRNLKRVTAALKSAGA